MCIAAVIVEPNMGYSDSWRLPVCSMLCLIDIMSIHTVPENPQPFKNFNGNMEVVEVSDDAVVSILKALDG